MKLCVRRLLQSPLTEAFLCVRHTLRYLHRYATEVPGVLARLHGACRDLLWRLSACWGWTEGRKAERTGHMGGSQTPKSGASSSGLFVQHTYTAHIITPSYQLSTAPRLYAVPLCEKLLPMSTVGILRAPSFAGIPLGHRQPSRMETAARYQMPPHRGRMRWKIKWQAHSTERFHRAWMTSSPLSLFRFQTARVS